MRAAVRAALKRGWKYILVKKPHHRLEWKDGRRVTASLTPSCHHAVRNFEADLRRIERNPIDKDKT